MNFKKFTPLLLLPLLFVLPALAQQDTISLKTIIKKTAKLANEHPIEKVYLHMDKPYYSVGDTIWFKGYITAGVHQPSELSKIVYVDVITGRDSLVQTLRIAAFNGIAFGDIPLTQANYKQGNYRIRAYTNWMRNFDDSYFFNKNFTIGNAIDKPVITQVAFSNPPKTDKTNVRILFKSAEGVPYANKKVNWTIVTTPEADKPMKGKEETDANGYLNLSFTTSKLPDVKTSQLVTVFDLGDRKMASNSFPLRAASPAVDVQFFPEGGDMLTGVRTKVAFKAIKADGLGTDIKGTVTDNDGKTVAEFKAEHLGMGTFAITPETGKSYTANVILPDGSTKTFDLPRVRVSGISLSVVNSDPERLQIKLIANDAFFQQNQSIPLYLIAQSGGFIYFAAQTVLDNQVYTATIAKNKFPTGIVQITVFSDRGRPLSERIVFVKQNDQLDIAVSTAGKTSFGPRKKVSMQITAKSKATPVESNLSIAVIDETKVPFDENAETTILTSLLLSSDLKGYIEKPNYYFNHPTDKTNENLDILMLTQGYRRISYRDILADKYPGVFFMPEQGIEITGTLRNQTGMPINKGNVRLLIPDKNFSTQTVTDPSGNFRFQKVVLLDSSKITLNARNNVNANNLMMTVDPMTLPGLSKNINVPDEVMNIDSTLGNYLQNSKRIYNNTHVLKEVTIHSTLNIKKPSHADYPELMGLSMDADHTISGDRFTGCAFFATCLQTMVMGLTYDNGEFYISRDYNQGKKVPVQIYLNSMPVDVNALSGVNASQVESVEIFLSDGVSGINRMNNTSGVMVINTKKMPVGKKITQEQLKELFPPSYVLTFAPKGYTMAREFYSPKYIAPPSVTQRADLRTTIYWNPKLITDKTTGAATVEFYNADAKGTYKAIVEGIDADGNIGRFVYRYKVE